MAFSAVRRLADRLREEAEKRQRARQVGDQAELFRQWQRLGDAPALEFMGMASPGSLNPLGMDYERARIEDDTLRPSNYEERQQRDGLRGLAEGFAPGMEEIGALGLQAGAFRGYEPEEFQQAVGGGIAREFFEQVPEEQYPTMQALAGGLGERGVMPEEMIAAAQAPPEVPLGQAFGLGYGAPGTMGPEGLEILGLGMQLPDEQQQLEQAFLAGQAGAEAQGLLGEPAPGLFSLGTLEAALEADRALVEAQRPWTEPIGQFLGRGFAESKLPGASRAVETLGGPADIGGKVGAVAGPEVLAAQNLIPIPIVDDVLRVLARGAPLAGKLLSRSGRQATRAELRQLAGQIKTFGRTSPEVAQQADQAVGEIERVLTGRQAPVEEALRPVREAAAPVGPRAAEANPRAHRLSNQLMDTVNEAEGRGTVARLDLETMSREMVEREFGTDPTVTLFRGVRPEADLQEVRGQLGRYWTLDEGKARSYAGPTGEVWALDVPASRAVNPAFIEGGIDPSLQAQARRLGPRAAEGVPPAGRPAAQAPPARAETLGGGAPLTVEELAARNAPVEAAAEAIATNPGREAREAWRLYAGAQSEGNIRRGAWANDVYDQAREAGIPIVRGAPQPPNDEVVGIMERALDFERGVRGRAPVAGYKPEQRGFAQALYDRIDQATERLIAADPEFAPHAMEDYFPHLFKVSKRKGAGARGLQLRPGFTEKRKLEGTLGQILNERPDLDLVTWDPVDFVVRHEAAVDNYIASLEAIRGLRARGVITPAKAAPSATWRTPDISPFKMRQKLQGWVAEPKVAQTLEEMFGGSVFDEHGALKVLKGVREAGFKVKVFGGLFQGIDYSFREFGLGLSELARGRPRQMVQAWFSPVRGVARSLIPKLDRATLKAAEKNPKLMALYKNGLAAGVDPSIADRAIRGLGGIVPQTVAGRQIPGARGLQQVVEFVSGGAYHKFHQETLEQAGLVMLEKNLRKGLPLEEAARVTVEETNVFFSSIPNWQSAVKSSTGRDILKFPFFATGELEGWFRLPVQAPAGFAGIIGATVLTAEMLNKLFTGEWLSREQLIPYELDPEEFAEIRKGPQAALRVGVPGIDYNTRFLRPELPWKGPDGRSLYLDILGQADTPFRFALDPLFAVQTRLGQFPRAGIDIAAITHGERPAFGERVESPLDFAKFAGQQVSPISVSGLAGTERGRIGLAGAGIQVGGFNVSAQRLSEIREELIMTEHKAGNLVGEYDQLPPPQLVPTDREFLEGKYPELFVEPGERYTEDVLAGVGEREMGAIRSADLDDAKQDRAAALDALKPEAQEADASDQDVRRRLETLGKNALSAYRTRTEPIFEELFAEQEEPGSRYHRLAQQYGDLQDKYAGRFTAADPDPIWDAYQEEFDRTFSEEEQELMRREFGVNDHEWERARADLTRQLRPYYEIDIEGTRPQARKGRYDRKRLRLTDAEIDGALWALGRIAKVRSRRNRRAAVDAFFQLYGVRLGLSDVEWSRD